MGLVFFLGYRNFINSQKLLGCKKVNSIFQAYFGLACIFSSINMLINFVASCVSRLKNLKICKHLLLISMNQYYRSPTIKKIKN